MSKQDKAKIVVNFASYNGFVLDADKALAIMEMMRGAEKHRSKYSSSGTTQHVWTPDGEDNLVEFRYLTDAQYALAKIAGKPED